jgi:hypothetical protein
VLLTSVCVIPEHRSRLQRQAAGKKFSEGMFETAAGHVAAALARGSVPTFRGSWRWQVRECVTSLASAALNMN